jgi:chorismate dehydratase
LQSSELDVALIPSFEFFRIGDAEVISNACIGCRGPVRSVKLLFNKAPEDVRTLALDEGSRTSAALAQILLRKRFGLEPSVLDLPIDADFRCSQADAVLVIGDRAMNVPDSDYRLVWDLGEVWRQTTGLPFVFAMWVLRTANPISSEDALAVTEALEASRDQGLASVSELAKANHANYQITEDDCLRYFTEQLHFTLGEKEQQALELFRELAIEYNLLPTHTDTHQLQTS